MRAEGAEGSQKQLPWKKLLNFINQSPEPGILTVTRQSGGKISPLQGDSILQPAHRQRIAHVRSNNELMGQPRCSIKVKNIDSFGTH